MYRPPVSLSYALWSRKVPSTRKFQLLMMMIFWILEDRFDDMLGINTYFYDNAHYKRRSSIQALYCPVGLLSYAFWSPNDPSTH
jgi:hypothetical protein